MLKRGMTTMLAGGRFTIPKALRDAKGWSAGTRLNVEVLDDYTIVLKPALEMLTSGTDWTVDS